MDARRFFNFPHTPCQQDEEYLSHFVLELSSYGKNAIVDKPCILFPKGFHPAIHQKLYKFPTDDTAVLQQYILPEIDEKVVDAILVDFVASYTVIADRNRAEYRRAQIEALNIS